MNKPIVIMAATLALTGCQTLSFAPPQVDLAHVSTDGTVNRRCELTSASEAPAENVAGGLRLVDNFLHVYRCAARSAANGRQGFEVPALLGAAGAGIAAAFGAGADVAIAGGSAVALLGSGKNYYAPGAKAAIYQRGLDAIACINNEAVGVPSFEPLIEAARDGESRSIRDSSVEVSAELQYFRMLKGALVSVEAVMLQRLSGTGTFDAAGLVAEIEAIRTRVEAAEEEREEQSDGPSGEGEPAEEADDAPSTDESGDPAPDEVSDVGEEDETEDAGVALARRAARPSSEDATGAAKDLVTLDLRVLQPKLQQCVVRAKL